MLTTLGLDRLPRPAADRKLISAGPGGLAKSMSWDEFLANLGSRTARSAVIPALTQRDLSNGYQDWVYTAVSTIAERMMDLDYYLSLERIRKGKTTTEQVAEHPFLDLLEMPNPFHTGVELHCLTWIHLLTTGNAYWHLPRDLMLGLPERITPVLPHEMGQIINRRTMQVTYIHRSDGVSTLLPAEDVIHFKLPSAINLYFGASPIQAFAFANDISLYSQVYQANYFLNSAIPEYVIAYPENVQVREDDVAEIWDMVKKKHQGVKNAHLPMVVGSGAKIFTLGASNVDARYLSASETTKEKIICGAYKVPLAKVGMVADFNRANSAQADITFNKECIKPKATLFCARVNRDFLDRFYEQPDGYRLRLQFSNPVPSDRELEINEREHFIRSGLKSRNAILREMGEPEVENGDEMLIQSGLIPYEALSLQALDAAAGVSTGEPGKSPLVFRSVSKGDADADLWRTAIEQTRRTGEMNPDLWAELWRRHVKALNVNETPMRQAVRKYFRQFEDRLLGAVEARWASIAAATDGKTAEKRMRLARQKDAIGMAGLIELEPEGEYLIMAGGQYITDAQAGSLMRTLNRIGVNRPGLQAEEVERTIRDRIFKFKDNVLQGSVNDVRRVLLRGVADGQSVGEVSAALRHMFDGWQTWRAARVARTEINGAVNQGSVMGYVASGVVERKSWLTSIDERTRSLERGDDYDHVAMHGVESGVNEAFDVQGDRIEYPGDYAGDPANIINCRCTTIPVIE